LQRFAWRRILANNAIIYNILQNILVRISSQTNASFSKHNMHQNRHQIFAFESRVEAIRVSPGHRCGPELLFRRNK
jgi:hypothetical protein